ncbi:MAG TPA: nuclear transport factor 2 family protein [Gammaproteobacteria bacterium]|nr:nuclear transport factor 2 family protein [Gammaproteobacteria bacterium]HIO02548.1 nuclear transport factor 2 family protein [Alphaproteobacteria bacterium]
MTSGFTKFISTFGSGRLEALPEIYSSTIQYEDPINKVQGLDHLRLVFEDLLKIFSDIKIQVMESASTNHSGYVRWLMIYRFGKKEYAIDGISRLEFDSSGLICKHKDYWDASFPLYGTFPILGLLMRAIKKMVSVKIPT